jgi:hypothetical protein
MGRAPDDKGGATRLVAVKAVSPAYPLRGKLQLRDAPASPVQVVAAAPQPGTVWVDAALLDALQLQVGDPLLLGDARFTIARIIVIEPDRGAGFSSFAPRVMLAECRPARHRPHPARQPRELPHGRGRARRHERGQGRRRGAQLHRVCRRPDQERALARHAWKACKAAAPKCARRWTAPRSS